MKKKISLKSLLLLTVAGALVVAFYGGRYVGQADERKVSSAALENVLGRNSIDNFIVLRSALDKMRAGNVVEADSVIAAYAKLQISSVRKCGQSPNCRASAGPAFPAPEELEAVSSLSPIR